MLSSQSESMRQPSPKARSKSATSSSQPPRAVRVMASPTPSPVRSRFCMLVCFFMDRQGRGQGQEQVSSAEPSSAHSWAGWPPAEQSNEFWSSERPLSHRLLVGAASLGEPGHLQQRGGSVGSQNSRPRSPISTQSPGEAGSSAVVQRKKRSQSRCSKQATEHKPDLHNSVSPPGPAGHSLE